jgi:hypothetical protein
MGQELAQPLKVKVVNNAGRAVKGQLVSFRVTTGGGAMYAGVSVTDASGIAQDWWTLGMVRGEQKVDVVSVDPTTGAKQSHGSFTATAQSPAALAGAPGALVFPGTLAGGVSATQVVTIDNTGDATSGALAASLGGPDAGQFAIVSNSCAGATLDAVATCTIGVQFAPGGAAGLRSATLTTAASPGGSVTTALSGTVLAPAALSVSPSAGGYPDTQVGSTTPLVFTVTNTGGAPTTALSLTLGGAHPAAFFVSPSSTCLGQVLAGGASCQATVFFTPPSAGSFSATFTASATTGGTVQVPLSGIGREPARLEIAPTSHDFGSVVTGQQSALQTFTVTNPGGYPTGALTVFPPLHFTVTNDLCRGVQLSPGGSCSIGVRYTPGAGAPSPTTGTVSVTGTPGGSASASLTGTPVAPAQLTASPTSHNFGSVLVGGTSAPRTFTVTNIGGAPSAAIGTALTGTDAGRFSLSANGCAGTLLAAGATCTVDVTVTPSDTRALTASLTISASGVTPVSAALSGAGVFSSFTLSPTSTSFPVTAPGSTSAATVFTLTNTGTLATGVLGTQFVGTNAGDFTFTSNGCSGVSLAVGASCTVEVAFAPTSLGGKSATLFITDGTTSRTASLSGFAQ